MTHQPEWILENNLVMQLVSLGYSFIQLNNEADVLTAEK